jgi:hypothetical protein
MLELTERGMRSIKAAVVISMFFVTLRSMPYLF